MAFSDLLNPVFSPLLKMDPLLAIILISFLISLMIVLIYKKVTDQDLMKDLKSEIKEFQKKMKELKDKPDQMMKIQRQAMETNTKYMMHSFKPTLFTFIPIILIFGWLNAHMAYYPLVAGNQFSININFADGTVGTVTLTAPQGITLLDDPSQTIQSNSVQWDMKGDAGTYTMDYTMNGTEFSHSLIITNSINDRQYANPVLSAKNLGLSKDSGLQTLTISNRKIQPFKEVPLVGSIPWIGGFGWLGSYIVFSIIFSMLLRKVLKVY